MAWKMKHSWIWHEGIPWEEEGESRWKGEDQGHFYFQVSFSER